MSAIILSDGLFARRKSCPDPLDSFGFILLIILLFIVFLLSQIP